MPPICRLCLKSEQSKNSEHISVNQTDSNGVSIATLVKTLVPELYLGLSVNPVICSPCYDALRDAYSFRLQCLRSENLIGIFLRESRCSSVTIALQDVVSYWTNVYKNSACQTEVARSNLSEWFGLKETHDNFEQEAKCADIKRPPPIIIDPRRTFKVVLTALSDKPNTITEPEKDEETSAIQKVESSSNEGIEKNDLDRGSYINQLGERLRSFPKDPCNCPSAVLDCPTSDHFTKEIPSYLRMDKRRQHRSCVLVCDYRHSQECKYYKPSNNASLLRLPVPPLQTSRKAIEAPNSEKMVLQETSHINKSVFVPVARTGSDQIEPENDSKDFRHLQKSTEKLIDCSSKSAAVLESKRQHGKVDNSGNQNSKVKMFGDTQRTLADKNNKTINEKIPPEITLKKSMEVNEKIVNKLPGNRSAETSKKVTPPAISNTAQNKDGESLGIITYNYDDSLPKQTANNPRSLLRVRPVSSMTQIRTLNHELFPHSSKTSKILEKLDVSPSQQSNFVKPSKPSTKQVGLCNCPSIVDNCAISKNFTRKLSSDRRLIKSRQHKTFVIKRIYRHIRGCKYYKPKTPLKTYRKKEHYKTTIEAGKTENIGLQETSHTNKPVPCDIDKDHNDLSTKDVQQNQCLQKLTQRPTDDSLKLADLLESKRPRKEDDNSQNQNPKSEESKNSQRAPGEKNENAAIISKKTSSEIIQNCTSVKESSEIESRTMVETNEKDVDKLAENRNAETRNKDTPSTTSDLLHTKDKLAENKNGETRNKDTPSSTSDPLHTKDKLTENRNAETRNKDTPSTTSDPLHTKGIMTLQPDNTPSENIPDKPMPKIRVRPVSSLKQIRTLNHELFPQSSDADNIQEKSTVSTMQPAKLAKSPIKSPVVLNSKLAITKSVINPIMSPQSSSQSIEKTVNKPYIKSSSVPTRLIPVSIDHVKKAGIKPKNIKKITPVKRLKVLLPTPYLPLRVKLNMVDKDNKTGAKTSKGSDVKQDNSLGNKTAEHQEIYIKEEPLELTESDSVDELKTLERPFERSDTWDSETTRSASETSSLVDPLVPESLSRLICNMPDLVEEEFDQPEYVHINSVSYDDLHKLMKEAKENKKKVEKTKTNVNTKNDGPITNLQPQDNNVFIKLSNTVTDKKLSTTSQIDFDDLSKTQTRQDVEDPLYVPLHRNRRQTKLIKRLRLVPVDVDESKNLKKRTYSYFTSKSNFQACTTENQKDVCVLFTNFTSDGDYINDHDYLVNPYFRNNMYMFKGDVEKCMCLLCGWFHPVANHIEHMNSHGTRCVICKVDFHNVFILNLHVRVHTYHCPECDVNVTYARYRHHAETHNLSPLLSNIEVPPEDKFIKRKVKRKAYPTLDVILPKPKIKCNRTGTNDNSSVSLRRSPRITKSKEIENIGKEGEEEEACIYDKNTKSFITPSAERRLRLLARRNAKNDKTECKNDKDTANAAKESSNRLDSESLNLTNLLSDAKQLDSNINISQMDDNILTSDKGILKKTSPQKSALKTVQKKRIVIPKRTTKRKRIQSENISQETTGQEGALTPSNKKAENKQTKGTGSSGGLKMEKNSSFGSEKSIFPEKVSRHLTANFTGDLASNKTETEVKAESDIESSVNTKREMRSMYSKKEQNLLGLQKHKVTKILNIKKLQTDKTSNENTPKEAKMNQVRVKVNLATKRQVHELTKTAKFPIRSCAKIKSRNAKMSTKSEVQRITNAASSQILPRKILIRSTKVFPKNESNVRIKRLRPVLVSTSALKPNFKTKTCEKTKMLDADHLDLAVDGLERSKKNRKTLDTSTSNEKQVTKKRS